MRKKDTLAMEKAIALKAVRTVIRLKYSEKADREINETLPQIDAAMEAAAQAGEPFRLDLAELLS